MDFVSKVKPIYRKTAPGRVVVIVTEDHPSNGDGRQCTFAACRWRDENGAITRYVKRFDLSAAQVWDFVCQGSRCRATTIIYAMHARAVADRLKMMDLARQGDVDLLVDDDWSDFNQANPKPAKRNGTVSLSPGAFFVDFALPRGRGKFRLVDLANFFPDLSLPETCGASALALAVGTILSWHALLRRERLGRVRCTVPAQALEGFRARFLPSRLYYRRSREVCEAERSSYYGGRCECFRLGRIDGPIYELDTSYCYLRVAQNAMFPIAYIGEGPSQPVSRHGSNPQQWWTMSLAQVVAADSSLPMRCGRRVIYPVGTWRGIYVDYELDEFARRGGCVERLRTWWYAAKPIFNFWSMWGIAIRRQVEESGNPHLTMAVKRMVVSVFGKLGQRGEVWRDTGVVADDADVIGGIAGSITDPTPGHFRVLQGREQVSAGRPCPRMGAPAVASYVTALGRGLLQARIDLAGAENVFYVDTDSLLVNQAGYNALQAAGVVRANDPGYLRLLDVHDWVVLHSPKHYLTPRKRVHSGKPPVVLSPAERERARNEPVDFAAYHHGRVQPDGVVVPWRVSMESIGPDNSTTEMPAFTT